MDQFYKNTDFPAPSSPEIVARAIQLGVQDGAFGLALSDNGPIDVALLRYQETVALGAIAFEPGVYLVNRERCEALREAQRQKEAAERQQEMAQEAGEQGEETAVTGTTTTTGGYTVTTSGDGGTKSQETPSDQKPFSYKQVRLVIGGIPASRIADVNRGIFMPLGAASDTPLTFTLTIEVSSEEGITSATLENKVKETIRQIGARIVVEETG